VEHRALTGIFNQYPKISSTVWDVRDAGKEKRPTSVARASAAAAAATTAMDEGDRCDLWCVQCHTWRTLNCSVTATVEREREIEREKERGDIPTVDAYIASYERNSSFQSLSLASGFTCLLFFCLLHILGLVSSEASQYIPTMYTV